MKTPAEQLQAWLDEDPNRSVDYANDHKTVLLRIRCRAAGDPVIVARGDGDTPAKALLDALADFRCQARAGVYAANGITI